MSTATIDLLSLLEMHVSHKTIYQSLFLQARGELRTQLKLALRTGRTRQISLSRVGATKGKILGKDNKSQIATLVERQT